ncbi:MAG: iron-containing alcohol dehydrogenase family protein [Defluviitaleaceae bacterium]|nr:iron-containing alcohol dehydrogenase family protein [Defluviitaleaceae bacterium]MCL2274158.1 iron-containing alcohol dehydrogenase family protein [Defluviitaleaceae bacterium]
MQIEIPYLLKIGRGKIKKVGNYLADKNMKKIALFLGEGIEGVVGAPLRKSLNASKIIVAHEQVVSTVDVDAITHTAFTMPATTAIVGVGGGKALDFAKYAAQLLKLPCISIPTAISNDGFSSPSASLTVLGKRKSVKSSSPFGVVIDLDVIKGNPDALLFSGIGDMMSKATALRDWRTARDKGLARFVDLSAILAYNSLDIMFLKHTFNIHKESFQRSLASSLTMSGLAMEIAGSSRPASGSEHLISHALDSLCEKPQLHGIQVGVATYLCALLQNNSHTEDIRIVLERTGFFSYVEDHPLDYDEFIAALEYAPKIKENFYTILSESDSFPCAAKLIKTNPQLKKLIVKGAKRDV